MESLESGWRDHDMTGNYYQCYQRTNNLAVRQMNMRYEASVLMSKSLSKLSVFTFHIAIQIHLQFS